MSNQYDVLMAKLDERIVKTRGKVLLAAQDLFIEKGISSVTHLAVAERSGVGRKTVYRHWPTVNDLLADALSAASFPPEPDTGSVAKDLCVHLNALHMALRDGPLGYILFALNARARFEPDLAPLRDRLTHDGCQGLVNLLERGIERGELRHSLNTMESAATLEGPIFYYALIRQRNVPADFIETLVAEFLEVNLTKD